MIGIQRFLRLGISGITLIVQRNKLFIAVTKAGPFPNFRMARPPLALTSKDARQLNLLGTRLKTGWRFQRLTEKQDCHIRISRPTSILHGIK